MPQDREPDQKLEDLILEVEDSLIEEKHSSIIWIKIYNLKKKKVKLDRQFFNADDRLLGDSYDKQDIKRLKYKIYTIDKELLSLKLNINVAAIRAQEKKKNIFKKNISRFNKTKQK